MKLSIPQGTRDFGADIVRKRHYIFNTIRVIFEKYGFQPLETPAMENMETLMGKYGEEGDKLIFKILNNGLDNPNKQEKVMQGFTNVMAGKNDKNITERALRYDLTIPFARFVAMHHSQITFPFKRYQIQPVWRADRPQRGRYREFYQCDCDVVGSKSLINEIELIHIYLEAFEQLGIDIEIRINNRKILAALAELCGGVEKLTDITIAIDKLDKIGIDKVKDELANRNLSQEQTTIIEKYLSISGDNSNKIRELKKFLANSPLGTSGIQELSYLLSVEKWKNNSNIVADLTLARGLNYYTGTIFEIKAKNVQMGSIGGGGRYDDLTGLFGVSGIPGVGISFGIDRIYDVMDELNLFPSNLQISTDLLFFNLGEAESIHAFQLMQQLREKGVRCEMYHEKAKFDKQFKYADKKRIPFICIIGEQELQSSTCVLKRLNEGVQEIFAQHDIKQIINYIRKQSS